MDKELKDSLEKRIVNTFKCYGYDITGVEEFDLEEQEDGLLKGYMVTICHHKEDEENGYPEEDEAKPFWFDLIPNNGTYKISNIKTG